MAQCEAAYLQQLLGPNRDWSFFGWSMSVDGDFAAIGTPGLSATLGRLEIYQKQSQWVRRPSIVPDDLQPGDQYGAAVVLSSAMLVVGAPLADRGDGPVGQAYVYAGGGSNWVEWARLWGPYPEPYARFGAAVAIVEDRVLVGAPLHDAAAADGGAVYVYRLSGSQWEVEEVLTNPDAEAGAAFGAAMAASGSRVCVSAPGEDTTGSDTGAVYVYEIVDDALVLVARITSPDPDPGDRFGESVALRDEIVAVGEPRDGELGAQSGAVYIFDGADGWSASPKFTQSRGGGAGTRFGMFVDIDGPVVYGKSVTELADNGRSEPGVIWTIVRRPGGWVVRERIEPALGIGSNGEFGSARPHRGQLLWGLPNGGPGADRGTVQVFDVCDISPCFADFNGDASVDTLDVLGYIQAWVVTDPLADMDADGSVTTLDCLSFLNNWRLGCS
jgi:hypothetical protein